MIKKAITILLFIAIAATAAVATDESQSILGYGKTIWGMTPDEVLSAETPRAEKLEKTEKYKTGLGMVTIKEIEIGIHKFSVIFIFDESNQKLKQVNLTGLEKKNPGINSQAFSTVEKLLTEKYGPPTFKEGKRLVSWKLPKTSIDLNHANIPGIITQVTVSYKPSDAGVNSSRDL